MKKTFFAVCAILACVTVSSCNDDTDRILGCAVASGKVMYVEEDGLQTLADCAGRDNIQITEYNVVDGYAVEVNEAGRDNIKAILY